MALLSAAEYDAMLATLGGGDTVTLGATTVSCIIGGGDSDQLRDGDTPTQATVGVLVVTVRTGALTGLRAGTSVTLRSATYTVDHVVRLRNDALTQFMAYPS